MRLLQVTENNRELWTSLSPVVRSRVSELSTVTNVFHMERLVGIIKFFDCVDRAQLNYVFQCSDLETLHQLVGFSCSGRSLTMMQTVIRFLIRHYTDSRWFK